MTLGNLVAAVQTNVKRMMAYSSIAQVGYILVGFIASISGNNADGTTAVLFFFLGYVITYLGPFSRIIALAKATGGEKYDGFPGLGERPPLLGAWTAVHLRSAGGCLP